MQIIVISDRSGETKTDIIERVTSISDFKGQMVVNFKDEDGKNATRFIRLDRYTEAIIR